MSFFTTPRSFALNDFLRSHDALGTASMNHTWVLEQFQPGTLMDDGNSDSHPDFGHLCLLIFEAVLQVVFVALPGYIVARQGLFDAESQKFVAQLNLMVFTPCLIFSKLAKQLTADKLSDLAIIPAIYAIQALVSYSGALTVSKCLGLKKRPRNYIVAMGIFGNSNSLPISLVMALSKTISGLHWSKIPGDNDDDVASRGILYLLIFQQIGQLLRWTWGYNVLLKPKEAYSEEEGGSGYPTIEEGIEEDFDDSRTITSVDTGSSDRGLSGEATPLLVDTSPSTPKMASVYGSTGNLKVDREGCHDLEDCGVEQPVSLSRQISRRLQDTQKHLTARSDRVLSHLPEPVELIIRRISWVIGRFAMGVWNFMNPPLWAMLAALVVASVPSIQAFFFAPRSFMNKSVIHGIEQSAGVAIPLILVVLGANLARNTLPAETFDAYDASQPSDKKLLIGALVSRMLLPTIIMAPILAAIAKFLPISILSDPVFVIVVFLISGAPPALQLAQICQINNVYMGATSQMLFQSYVVWILPSTLLLVNMALKTVEWANVG